MALLERKPTSPSIWRRFVKRDSRHDITPTSSSPHTPLARSVSQKLQRRATPTIIAQQKKDHRDATIPTALISPSSKPPRPLTPTTPRILASDMRTTPFPASPYIHTVPWNVFLPPTQVYSLVMGFLPTDMDDKWFIYSEGPDSSGKLKVHFHRSWTGLKIATLFVVVDWKGEGAGTIVGIKWNGSDQTVGMEVEEAKYMVAMCCAWVLGVHLEDESGMVRN